MTKPLKKSVCAFCGKTYTAKERRWKPTCSPECGELRLKTAIRNLKDRSGPAYHKWRNNLKRHVEMWNALNNPVTWPNLLNIQKKEYRVDEED